MVYDTNCTLPSQKYLLKKQVPSSITFVRGANKYDRYHVGAEVSISVYENSKHPFDHCALSESLLFINNLECKRNTPANILYWYKYP